MSQDSIFFCLVHNHKKAPYSVVVSHGVKFSESIISPSTEPLRNLGAWFDCHFNLNLHITKTCRSAFFHLLNIRRVRKYLRIESAEKLVHAFITSRLDYCNSLLHGLPYCALNKLQRVQNGLTKQSKVQLLIIYHPS